MMMSCQCLQGRVFVCWKLQTVAGGSAGMQGEDFGELKDWQGHPSP